MLQSAPPVIADAALASAASDANHAVAPGEVVVLIGTSYGSASLAASRPEASGHLPTEVSNTRLWFDNTPAPIVCARFGQAVAVAPFEVSSQPADYADAVRVSRAPARIPSPSASFPLYLGSFTLPAGAGSHSRSLIPAPFRKPLLCTVAIRFPIRHRWPYHEPAPASTSRGDRAAVPENRWGAREDRGHRLPRTVCWRRFGVGGGRPSRAGAIDRSFGAAARKC